MDTKKEYSILNSSTFTFFVLSLVFGVCVFHAKPAKGQPTTLPCPVSSVDAHSGFYDAYLPNAPELNVADGKALKCQRISTSYPMIKNSSNYRLLFKSTGFAGDNTPEVAMLFVPNRPIPAGGFPIVVWAHGTTGIGDNCAPSKYNTLYPEGPWHAYADVVGHYVQQGYAVLEVDYEGLGTPGPHPWLDRDSHGRSILNSVRAAIELMNAPSQAPILSNRFLPIGHSQGGIAAAGAAELYTANYDNVQDDLELVGAVLLAPGNITTDIFEVMSVDKFFQAYMGYSVETMKLYDPTFQPSDFLKDSFILDNLDVAAEACWDEWFYRNVYGNADIGILQEDYQSVPSFQNYLNATQFGKRPIDVPILVQQGTFDALYYAGTGYQDMMSNLCDNVQDGLVNEILFQSKMHDNIMWIGQAETTRYVNKLFSGDTSGLGEACPRP